MRCVREILRFGKRRRRVHHAPLDGGDVARLGGVHEARRVLLLQLDHHATRVQLAAVRVHLGYGKITVGLEYGRASNR